MTCTYFIVLSILEMAVWACERSKPWIDNTFNCGQVAAISSNWFGDIIVTRILGLLQISPRAVRLPNKRKTWITLSVHVCVKAVVISRLAIDLKMALSFDWIHEVVAALPKPSAKQIQTSRWLSFGNYFVNFIISVFNFILIQTMPSLFKLGKFEHKYSVSTQFPAIVLLSNNLKYEDLRGGSSKYSNWWSVFAIIWKMKGEIWRKLSSNKISCLRFWNVGSKRMKLLSIGNYTFMFCFSRMLKG